MSVSYIFTRTDSDQLLNSISLNINRSLEYEKQKQNLIFFVIWWVTLWILQAVQWRPSPTLRKTPDQGEGLGLIRLLIVCSCVDRVCLRIVTYVTPSPPLQVPSRLKEALKTAKESLERRLHEEQRVVRHYSHFFFISELLSWRHLGGHVASSGLHQQSTNLYTSSQWPSRWGEHEAVFTEEL